MAGYTLDIDKLIEVVKEGGMVRTGVNVFNHDGLLLINQNTPISDIETLKKVERYGIRTISIKTNNQGGVWNQRGERVKLTPLPEKKKIETPKPVFKPSEVEKKIKEIVEVKKEADKKYRKAKKNIKKVIVDIKKTGGEFDYGSVEETVTELFEFITEREGAFSHITKELFSYDDYLYNHSINVCTIATAILTRFNRMFSKSNTSTLGGRVYDPFGKSKEKSSATTSYFPPEELQNISIGYFLHDIGKVLIPDKLLNKEGKFSDKEFEIIKNHSFLNGPVLLNKNKLENPYITNSVVFHHAPLYENEPRCYPETLPPAEIPEYVKICKLADIYDAMTSKRSYKEAWNPIGVVTNIFRSYANKDKMLQLVLHSFVKSIGVLPPGSIVELNNGQLAYVLESEGPVVILFTDTNQKTLTKAGDPINLSEYSDNKTIQVNPAKALKSPTDSYKVLPGFIKKALGGRGLK